jgi:hypothetical protein
MQLYHDTIVDNEVTECAICLANINNILPHLPCKHIFHIECILKWSKTQRSKHKKSSCPICKRKYDINIYAKAILKHNCDLIANIINKLEFIINNNNLSFINYIQIKYLIYNYKIIFYKNKYEKQPLTSNMLKTLNISLPSNIATIIDNTNFDKSNDINIKRCRKCCNFLWWF